LKHWLAQIELSERERIDSLDEQRISHLYHLNSVAEGNLGVGYLKQNDMDKAQHHCERSLYFAYKMKEGEMKTERAFESLKCSSEIHHPKGKFVDTKAVMEEAYINVSRVYDPEHLLALEAAAKLIEILGLTCDYYDAERCARICNQTLTRPPLDPESVMAARAAIYRMQLAI
jgi:hypothetical protein